MAKNFDIRPNELSVLEVMWEADKPLSQAQVLELISSDVFKNRASAYNMISSLLKKNLIEVAGIATVTKGFCRVFVPTITKEEYSFRDWGVFDADCNINNKAAKGYVSCLVNNKSISPELLDEIEAMIAEKRKEKE